MKNKTIGLLSLIIILLVFIQQSSAQSVKRQSMGSYGTNGMTGNVIVGQTIGQPFFTNGYTDSQVSLAPGFQQPRSYKKNQKKVDQEFSDLVVYPNPASESFVVERSTGEHESAIIKVTDLNGRLMWEEQVTQFETYRINSEHWQPGLYFISVSAQDNQYNNKSKVIITK